MEHQTNKQGRLFFQYWLPEQKPPKAVIALVHGQGEHSGRYAHVAQFFTEKGLAIMGVDLTGHGQSEGKRGHVDAYEQYLVDVDALLLAVQKKWPDVPVILYGHSMGGNIAANFALQHGAVGMFDYVLLTSPWLRLAFEPPALKETLGRLVRRILPAYTESSKLDSLLLSRDERVSKAYMDDPLVHDKISVSAYFGVVEAGIAALEGAGKLAVPTLLMHGDTDQVTSHIASREFAEKAPSSLLVYKEWPACFHELHNELEWEQVLQFAWEWIQKQLTS